MASYSKPTLLELLTKCRTQLADPSGRWWTDEQLIGYIQDWQDELNNHFEWVHTTYTLTATGSSVTLPSGERVVYVRQEGVHLPITDEGVLREVDPSWREKTSEYASAYVQYTPLELVPYPSLTAKRVWEIEQVTLPTLTTLTSTITVPAWVKWSCVPYVCMRAYTIVGPNHDLQKVARYKAKMKKWEQIFASVANKMWGTRYPRLKMGGYWERRLVRPAPITQEVLI
jgi:hypothetical protein